MAGGTKRTITGRTHGDSHQHDKREDKEDSLTSLGTREMIIYGMDAGEKTDKYATVTIRVTGDYKCPVPQNIKYELVNCTK